MLWLLTWYKLTIVFQGKSCGAIYLNNGIDSVADGVEGVLVLKIFWWTTCCSQMSHLRWPFPLSSDHNHISSDPDHISRDPNHMQTMLNKLRAYTQESLTLSVHKSQIMCLIPHNNILAPLLRWCAAPPTDTFKYLGAVCDRQINLNTAADAALGPFTAGAFRIK